MTTANELIPINYDSESPTVSGRELHAALGVETPYTKWFDRMCDYGFTEGKTYKLVGQICPTNNPKNPTTTRTDHLLSIAMAKELCMLQRTDKGKQFRQYFIAVEEAWNSPDRIMERALAIAHSRAIEAEQRIFALAGRCDDLEVRLNESLQFYTVAKYGSEFGHNWNIQAASKIGKLLSRYCRSNGYEVRRCDTHDERFGAVNSYPITAWEDFIETYIGEDQYEH